MGLTDGVLERALSGLAENPMVKDTIGKVTAVANGVVAAMKHFNTRLDVLETKSDRIIYLLENPSNAVPAGEHKLLQVLGEQKVGECSVVGCTNQAIHDHGDGVAVTATPFAYEVPSFSHTHESEMHRSHESEIFKAV